MPARQRRIPPGRGLLGALRGRQVVPGQADEPLRPAAAAERGAAPVGRGQGDGRGRPQQVRAGRRLERVRLVGGFLAAPVLEFGASVPISGWRICPSGGGITLRAS